MNEIFIYTYDYYGLRKERVEVIKETKCTITLARNHSYITRVNKGELDMCLIRDYRLIFYMTSENDKFVKDKTIEYLNGKIEVYKNKIQKCEETISEIQIQKLVTE